MINDLKNRVIYCGAAPYKDKNCKKIDVGGFAASTRIIIESHLFQRTVFYLFSYTPKRYCVSLFRIILDALRIIKILLRKRNYDIVMIQTGTQTSSCRALLIAYISKLLRRKVVLSILAGSYFSRTSNVSSALYDCIHRKIFSMSDAIFVECQSLIPLLKNKHLDTHFDWLPNFVLAHQIKVRKHAYALGACLKLIYAGRYTKSKGLLEMFEAVTTLCGQKKSNLELHLAGEGNDEQIMLHVRNSKAPFIINHGPLQPNQLQDLLSEMHVFLFPTTHAGEGHPGAINDALMNGLIILTTPHNALPSILPTESTLWLDKSHLASSLIEKILFLLKTPDFINRYSAFNSEFIRNRFTDTLWVPFLEAQFDKLNNAEA